MVKELSCPECKKNLFPFGFEHDEHSNLICEYCKSVVFAVTRPGEDKIKSLLNIPINQWQRKDCLPIKLNSSPTINLVPNTQLYGSYEMFGQD